MNKTLSDYANELAKLVDGTVLHLSPTNGVVVNKVRQEYVLKGPSTRAWREYNDAVLALTRYAKAVDATPEQGPPPPKDVQPAPRGWDSVEGGVQGDENDLPPSNDERGGFEIGDRVGGVQGTETNGHGLGSVTAFRTLHGPREYLVRWDRGGNPAWYFPQALRHA